MDSTPRALKAALEAIRDTALKALGQIEPQRDHSMRWKCKECQYIKHFTKPVSIGNRRQVPAVPRAQSFNPFCEPQNFIAVLNVAFGGSVSVEWVVF